MEISTGMANMVMIKALEDNVKIIGMTGGAQTKLHHTENLQKNEVMIASFTENTSAIKIVGKAQIITEIGEVTTE